MTDEIMETLQGNDSTALDQELQDDEWWTQLEGDDEFILQEPNVKVLIDMKHDPVFEEGYRVYGDTLPTYSNDPLINCRESSLNVIRFTNSLDRVSAFYNGTEVPQGILIDTELADLTAPNATVLTLFLRMWYCAQENLHMDKIKKGTTPWPGIRFL